MIAGLHKVALALLAAGCNPGGMNAADAASGESSRGEASDVGSVDASTTLVPDSSSTLDSSGAVDSTGESAPSDGGSVFLVELDVGAQTYACDIWAQDCPLGEKCMPWSNDGAASWNALRCAPVDPNAVAVGEACTVEGSGVSGIDNCEHGSMCYDLDNETRVGTCVAMCSGSEANPICLDPHMRCHIFAEGIRTLCLPLCDPLRQDCSPGEACYPIDGGYTCVPDVSGEEGVFGDGCEFLNQCDPGSFCAAAEEVPNCVGSSGCCSSFCDLSDPNASGECPGAANGQECIARYPEGEAPFGFENVGGCVVPT